MCHWCPNLGTQIAITGNGISTRGFRGLQAQTWQSNDVIEPASDLDLGANLPVSGWFLDPPNENTAPEGVTFRLARRCDTSAG